MIWLDVGNSRVKWQCTEGSEGAAGALAYQSIDDIREAAFWAFVGEGETVWVSSVARSELRDVLQAGAVARKATVRWATTETQNSGLKSAYQDVSRMGVDRWLTMLSLWRERRDAFVVIDAGSAITVDWVDQTGQHVGGHIVPGLNLLTRSLSAGTAHVKFEEQSWQRCDPGTSTSECVSHGVFSMALGYLEFAMKQSYLAVPFKIYITGGDAVQLQSFLSFETDWRPNLVLEGLRCYAEGER